MDSIYRLVSISISNSLRTLVEYSPSNQLKHTKKYFEDQNLINLITQKGFFCYEYLDNSKSPDISKMSYQHHIVKNSIRYALKFML